MTRLKNNPVWKTAGELNEPYVIGMIMREGPESFLVVDHEGINASMFKDPGNRKIYEYLCDQYVNMSPLNLPDIYQDLKTKKLIRSFDQIIAFFDAHQKGVEGTRFQLIPSEERHQPDFEGIKMLYDNFGVEKVTGWLRRDPELARSKPHPR